MPFALLDDQFHSNPKVIAMGLDGAGLYARTLSYIADYMTDGFVPESWVLPVAGRKRKLVQHLVNIGAWDEVVPGDNLEITDRSGNEITRSVQVRGYFVRDYCSFNPSSVEHEERTKQKSKAGKKGAVKRWGDNTSHSSSHGTSDSTRDGRTVARARAAPSPTQNPHPNSSLEKEGSSSSHDRTVDNPATRQAQALIRNGGYDLTPFSLDDELARLNVPETDRPALKAMAEQLRTAATTHALPSNAPEEAT